MRSVHFRVSDSMYGRLREEAEADSSSVANFAREAAVARTALAAHERGFAWSSGEAWRPVINHLTSIDDHDRKVRGRSARERRNGQD
jgi:hypothetical protein